MQQNNNNSRGSVVITIVLFMIILMTSAAVVLSGTLSRHIRASQDYLSSEKAFAGANTGMEEMRYVVFKQANTAPEDISGKISYDDQVVAYKVSAKNDATCIISSGIFRSLVRRVQLGGEEECKQE